MAVTSRRRAGPKRPAPRRADDDELRSQLRDAKLKVTHGRIAVLRALGASEGPISHAEVAKALSGEQLDKATVWRILVALTEVGLVERTDLGDRTWRFELRNTAMGHDPHPHFMCISCQSVQCLPREAVKIAPRIGRGVVEVQLKGRCEQCR